MGFDINLEKEHGEVLATVADPKNLLHRLLERSFDDEPLLVEIDWNGNTTFNRLQMPRFRAEWETLAKHTMSAEEAKLVAEVDELAERCEGGCISTLSSSVTEAGKQRLKVPKQFRVAFEGVVPAAPGWGMTRHTRMGAVERRMALWVNFLASRQLEKQRRSGALQGAVR